MQEEHFFQCPNCWEQISAIVDFSIKQQSYIEDCEVCCNPFHLNFKINSNEIVDFEVKIVQ